MGIGKISNAGAAVITAGNNGTYALAAGQQFNILINGPNQVLSATQSPLYGGNLVSVTFAASMFASIGAATATEVVAALNAAFAAQAAAGQGPAAVAAVSGSAFTISTYRTGPNATLQVMFDSTAAALTAFGITASTVVLGTGVKGVGAQPSAPLFVDVLSFTGDSSYPTGGTTGMTASLQAFTGDHRTIVGIVGQDCGGYVPEYVPSTDALKVYESGVESASKAPLAEVANATNLSSVTFNVLVFSY